MADRVDRPGHVVQEQDTNSAAPHHAGQKAVPPADPCPADEAGYDQRGDDDRYEQPSDHAKAAIVDQVSSVAVTVRGGVRVEQPTGVSVPEAPHRLDEAVAAVGMRTVRITALVGVLMMLAVIRDPTDDVSLDCTLPADRERVSNTTKGLKRAVREEPVIADGDPQTGDDVAHEQDRQLANADHPIPQQRDGHTKADERQDRSHEVRRDARGRHAGGHASAHPAPVFGRSLREHRGTGYRPARLSSPRARSVWTLRPSPRLVGPATPPVTR